MIIAIDRVLEARYISGVAEWRDVLGEQRFAQLKELLAPGSSQAMISTTVTVLLLRLRMAVPVSHQLRF